MVLDQAADVGAAAIKHHALSVGAGSGIGKAEAVLHVQAGSVRPKHARVGPEKTFFAVRVMITDAKQADRSGQKAGDVVNDVDVVAADVGESIGVLDGHPILKIRVAIVPLFEKAGGAQAELPERAFPIFTAGHERAVIEAFVILDADAEASVVGFALGFERLLVLQNEWLNGQDVLIVAQRRHDDAVVQLVGNGGDHDLARRHGLDDFARDIGLGSSGIAGIGQAAEGAFRERFHDAFRLGERFDGAAAGVAHRNLPDAAEPLQLIERRQKLIVHDHTGADDGDFRLIAHFRDYATAGCATSASANASSSAETLSAMAASVMTSGGLIFTVPPPKPTGLNMSTPFSIERRTTSQARSASGSFVPGMTQATPATRPLPSTEPICGVRVCRARSF